MYIFLLAVLTEIIAAPTSAKSISRSEFNVSFSLNEYHDPACYCLGDDDGLESTAVQMEYRSSPLNSTTTDTPWTKIANIFIGEEVVLSLLDTGTIQCMEFHLVQPEHGGGCCNCWIARNIMINSSSNRDLIGCGGSASLHRISSFLYPHDCFNGHTSGERHVSTYNTSCSNTTSHIQISFQLQLSSNDCNTINEFNEGVELALRKNTEDIWVPIAFYYQTATNRVTSSTIPLGEVGNLTIRGYSVMNIVKHNHVANTGISLELCNFEDDFETIQFRWLQTSRFRGDLVHPKDVWSLDNVNISFIDSRGEETILLEDSFNSDQLNDTLWPRDNIRNGDLSNECTRGLGDSALIFGLSTKYVSGQIIASRSVKTVTLEIPLVPTTTDSLTTEPLTTEPLTTETKAPGTTEPLTTEAPETISTTVAEQTTTTPPQMSPLAIKLAKVKTLIMDKIDRCERLRPILQAEPLQALMLIQNLTINVQGEDTDCTGIPIVLCLLGSTLSRLNTTDNNIRMQFTEIFIDVSNTVIQQGFNTEGVDLAVIGSSMLSIMDRLALQIFPDRGNISRGNIVLQTNRLMPRTDLSSSLLITSINSSNFQESMSPEMSLHTPLESVRAFAVGSQKMSGVKIAAFVYYNVEDLFPSSLPGENDNSSKLASGIVSTALKCGNDKCPSENLELQTPVRVHLEHSDVIKEDLENDDTIELTCVFWKFLNGRSLQDSNVFSVGEWSTRGCHKNYDLSNTSVTVCECNHLTHFAILLSPTPLNFSRTVTLSLNIISYVGVSVSVIAMTLTVITFVALKSLRNLRSFIHINLCINLGTAQIIFVVGGGQTGHDHVPVHCKVIAVFLHYFFLVSFMWMLMEGVFLYVILVRVFDENKKRYALPFTLASYGVPLLYLGFLALPLGFALPTQPNYGYNRACFLNPSTHFIWAFTAPVIVIFTLNFGFFGMAAIIMWQHKKKRTDSMSKKDIKKWLVALLSLAVIMGLTWVLGLAVVQVKELLGLAYIQTILMAFQGLFIFLIFVVFPKKVRKEYIKWWRAKVKKSPMLQKCFGGSKNLSSSSTSKRAISMKYMARPNGTNPLKAVVIESSSNKKNALESKHSEMKMEQSSEDLEKTGEIKLDDSTTKNANSNASQKESSLTESTIQSAWEEKAED